jgi:LacI family transcriptional regulator
MSTLDIGDDILDATLMAKASRARKPTVGLRAIADDLGVSVSLVSKVLSGRLGTSGANESKIRAIHAKALELNYRKNLLAEALRTGRQNVFAVMIHRQGAAGSTIVDDMVRGIAEEAARHGQRLLIHYYENEDEFRTFLPLVHQNSADGVIVAGIPHHEIVEDLTALHERGMSIVTIHDTGVDPQFPNVGIDQVNVSRLATLHLIDKGCRRIAHFHVCPMSSELPHDRYKGYLQALKERGLEQDDRLVIPVSDFAFERGQAAIKTLVESGAPFDGIVCQSDQHAVAALNYLVGTKIRVPEDVKIIGVDNAPFCQFAIKALSSVSQEFRERGREAVELLVRKLERQPVQSLQIAPVVWARDSSG